MNANFNITLSNASPGDFAFQSVGPFDAGEHTVLVTFFSVQAGNETPIVGVGTAVAISAYVKPKGASTGYLVPVVFSDGADQNVTRSIGLCRINERFATVDFVVTDAGFNYDSGNTDFRAKFNVSPR